MKTDSIAEIEQADYEKKFQTEFSSLLGETFHTVVQAQLHVIKDIEDTSLSMREIHLIGIVSKSKKGKTISEIARTFGITLASVTVMVNNLVGKGYLEKLKTEEDGRLIYAVLTKKGKDIAKAHDKFHQRLIDSVSSDLSSCDKRRLYECVEKLNNFFRNFK